MTAPAALTEAEAGRLAAVALGHVAREYPNKLDHVLHGPQDAATPRALHPIFYGSFDWHSCVHAYWMLARLRRRFPGMPEAARIDALFAGAFTAANVAAELAYLARPLSGPFERPYGWAWLLMLHAELTRAGSPHADTLAPLARAFAARFVDFLPRLTYPVRAGTHANTAFALILAGEYAAACADAPLRALCAETARRCFLADRACQAWEPGGEDFLSPALTEAHCMSAVLPGDGFAAWLSGFLPDILARAPATLFAPASVSDRSDGKIVHLDGLNLSRAWSWRSIAAALPAADPRRPVARAAAAAHLAAGLPHVAGDYMGEHWLATFAVLALEAPA
ncbi:MAG: DUF2891 domain-containing protein [Proteobacteria bacterium]|nr:DUF2891 domain-containing protein [Pseudomonadota bacterium]